MKKWATALALMASMALLVGANRPTVGVGSGVGATAQVGRSRTGIGYGSAAVDTVTVVLTMNPATGHVSAVHDTAVARADLVYTLGTDLAFAYAYIVQGDSINAALNYNNFRVGTGASTWDTEETGRRLGLVRADFAEVIPPGSTILDAKIRGLSVSAIYLGYNDSVSATLMTNPGDTLWWNFGTSVGSTANGYDYWAPAGWGWQTIGQDKGASAARNYPATSAGEWIMGRYVWQWGDVTDSHIYYPTACGGWAGCGSGISWAVGGLFDLSIKQCVQGVVDGMVNNGLLLGGRSNPIRTYFWQNWEQTAGTRNTPWIEITYTTKRESSRFPGGHDVAFVFQTDDEVKAANQAYAALFDSVGGHMTIYVREDAVNTREGLNERLDFAELMALHDAGHEIGSHSRWHTDNASLPWYGLNYWNAVAPLVATDYVRGMDPAGLDSTTTSTQWDYLLADTDPIWLYNGAVAEGYSLATLLASPTFAKTLACPGNVYTGEVIKAAVYHGYKGVRVSQTGKILRPSGALEWTDTAPRGTADADTARLGVTVFDPSYPRNMRLHPNSLASSTLVGDSSTTPSEAVVKHNIRQAFFSAIAGGNPVVSIFTHDQKSERGSGVYGGGINDYELRWILEVAVGEFNAWLPTTAEYQNWMMAHATPVATPVQFAQGTDYRYTAADRVWFKPWPSHYRPKW